jgi:hypothetical protein
LARPRKPKTKLAPIEERIVGGLNKVINNLLNCTITLNNNDDNNNTTSNNTNNTNSSLTNTTAYKYVWNKLPYTLRFLLLNQTKMKTQNNWDAMQVVGAAPKRNDKFMLIKWQSLPENVRASLLEQQAKTNAYFEMSFADWGWVSSANDANANGTLLSAMTDECAAIVPKLAELVGRITYDTVINGTCKFMPHHHRRPFKKRDRKGKKKERSTSSFSSSSESNSDSASSELGKFIVKMHIKRACLVRHGFMRVFSAKKRQENAAARIVEDAFIRAERFFK